METSVAYSQYYHVSFPSDRIAVRVMRTENPSAFASLDAIDHHAANLSVLRMMAMEQMLAEKAFARSCQLPDPFPEQRRSQLIRDLSGYYERYGLAKGENTTEVLVGTFEASVAEKARTIEF